MLTKSGWNSENWSEIFLDEYIHGDRFQELADWSFIHDNDLNEKNIGGRDGIVFCCTHYVEHVFGILGNQPHRFVLITHNSDDNVTDYLYSRKPSNVVHWFAQNVMIERSDLTPIPIGLERQGIVSTRDIASTMLHQIRTGRPKKQRCCYLNINPDTNDQERRHVLHALRWKFFYVTTRTRRIGYPLYVQEMASHQFVVSPPGNGVDCHRTWESLYLGSIPIVKDSACTRTFFSTGMMLHSDLSQLTSHDLEQFIHHQVTVDDRMLKISYWRKRIADVALMLLPNQVLPARLVNMLT